MAVSWPATLPVAALRAGYSFEDADGRVVTDMDQGAPRVRRLYTNTPRSFNVVFSMTPAQLAIWQVFYRDALYGGAAAVDLPVFEAAGAVVRTVLILRCNPLTFDDANTWNVGLQVVTA